MYRILKNIKLDNFQIHDSIDLDFCDGVNCIVGESDIGKSSIIRALRWVFTNKPAGISTLISENETKTKVSVKLDDIVITRLRGKSTNYYNIQGNKISNFGREVPEHLRKYLGDKVKILSESIDIGFSLQHNPAFMVGDSSSFKGKILDSICGNDIIIKCVRKCKDNLLEHNRESKYLNRKLLELEEEIGIYSWTIKCAADIKNLVKMRKELEEEICIVDRLEIIRNDLIEIDEEIECCEDKEEKLDKIENCAEFCLEEIGILENDLEKLEELRNDCVRWRKRYFYYTDRISNLEREEKKLEKELQVVLEQVEICPFCLRIMDDSCIKNIMSQI